MPVVTVVIGGESHSIDLEESLHIHNADAERHTVAADMAWWGTLAAAAEAHVERLAAAAASYRNKAIVRLLEIDAKTSEWRCKAAAESQDEYLELQNAIADAGEIAKKASTIHWALIRKMDMLRSLISGELGERRNIGAIGHEPVAAADDPRMKGYMANRKTPHKER